MSLSRFLSYPSNLQRQNFVNSLCGVTSSPMLVFSPNFSNFSSNKPHRHSNDSIKTVFNAYTFLNIPTVDIPDKFLESDLSPTNSSQPPFVQITPPTTVVLSTSSSSCTDSALILSSYIPDTPSIMTDNYLNTTSTI